MKNNTNDFLRYAGFFAPDLPLPMAVIAKLMDTNETDLTTQMVNTRQVLNLSMGVILAVASDGQITPTLAEAQQVINTIVLQLEKALRNHNKINQLAAFRPIGPHLVTLIEKLEPFAVENYWKLYSLMAQYLILVGKVDDACEYFSQAAKCYPEPIAPYDEGFITLILQTADAETARGNYGLAAVLVQQVILDETESFGQPQPLTLVKLANILFRDEDYVQAAALYLQAIQQQQKSSKDNNLVASHWNNLGRVYLASEQIDSAVAAFHKAADLWSHTKATEHHINRALALKNLTLAYQAQGDYPKAQINIEEAIHLSEAEYGVNHPDIGRDANLYALVLQAQGKSKAALEQFRRALRIDSQAFGQLHPEVALTLNNMGALYAEMGDIEKAKQSFLDASDILKQCSNEDHPYWQQVQENITRLSE